MSVKVKGLLVETATRLSQIYAQRVGDVCEPVRVQRMR